MHWNPDPGVQDASASARGVPKEETGRRGPNMEEKQKLYDLAGNIYEILEKRNAMPWPGQKYADVLLHLCRSHLKMRSSIREK